MRRNGWLVLAAFLGGILLANLSGKELLTTYGIMNTYFLNQYSYQAIDFESLFGHVLLERLKCAVFLFLLGKVLPGKPFTALVECSAVALLGFFMVVAITNVGTGGVGLILCGLFPQWIFYGVAFLMFALYRQDERYLMRERNFRKEIMVGRKHLTGGKYVGAGVFVLVLLLLLLGIVTESYLNPILMEKILKIF